MVFSSMTFLFLFLPIVLTLYFLSPTIKIKNGVLLVFSLFFYAWGEPVWIILMITTGMVDFVNGRMIGKYRGTQKSKAFLLSSLIINLSFLSLFKYGDFILSNINALFQIHLPMTNISLPIGISFYTFQSLSYTIDVYRGKVDVQKSFPDYLLYVSLFPQLIAGPIVRYADVASMLKDRKVTLDGFAYGCTRFLAGLGKKVLIANYAGEVAGKLLMGGMAGLTVTEAWFGILMYAFQIYFDFSGYSDMAIGLGHMFGFTFLENFNYPYISRSITEFWRRWHMSLSTFFRDYVYIPLGGNRHNQFRNILVVWFLTGLWHGASWNFIFWGMYFGVLLIMEKYLLLKVLNKIPAFFSWAYAFFFVLLGWVLFYYTDVSKMGGLLEIMFGFSGNPLVNSGALELIRSKSLLLITATVASTPVIKGVRKLLKVNGEGDANPMATAATVLFNVLMLYFCLVSLMGTTFNPFLYFRF